MLRNIMNTPRQESCFLAGALVEAWLLFLGRIEIEEGFFYMPGFFELAGKILYGILLLQCADSKGFLSAKQIFLLLAFPPKPFVAVEPLGLS